MNRLACLRWTLTLSLLLGCDGAQTTGEDERDSAWQEAGPGAPATTKLAETSKAERWQAAAATARAQAEKRYRESALARDNDLTPAPDLADDSVPAEQPASAQPDFSTSQALQQAPPLAHSGAPQAEPVGETAASPDTESTGASPSVERKSVSKSAAEERADKRWKSLQERRTRSLEYSEIADF